MIVESALLTVGGRFVGWGVWRMPVLVARLAISRVCIPDSPTWLITRLLYLLSVSAASIVLFKRCNESSKPFRLANASQIKGLHFYTTSDVDARTRLIRMHSTSLKFLGKGFVIVYIMKVRPMSIG